MNGRRVLDLGGTHARLRGTVTLDGSSASSTIEVQDPTTLAFTTISQIALGDIGIESQQRYDLAVFHANRSPRDSNYELTVDAGIDELSVCAPNCSDGITTITEECDLGSNNTDSGYGGCTFECRIGPYCGDGIMQAEFGEECDLGPGANSTCSNCRLNLR